jgi:chaperone required for assembly of F1-ATPase
MISVEAAIAAGFLEEDFQAQTWGVDPDYEKKKRHLRKWIGASQEFVRWS